MKKTLLALLAAFPFAGAATASPPSCAVSVANDPLVMRLGQDEFRIAFGVGGEQCHAAGCRGVITYNAEWTTGDGATRSDTRLLSFDVPRGAQRSIAVDRNYFDTAEGQHRTDIVKVSVQSVSCASAVAAN